ncbi:MAG: hypothetical protein NXY57DRAFT_1023452 [Lentinula lateritia]|uniref:Uncharacterized protein n=1 Tax=Lentinula lateritia TaxID=40482 RepID=A0ABQ8V3H4_9AGAR|nr:MAG: hypothetical protein NXY57DRAFT_1023452 [Lentinula lateritia]KAJ4470063.1 hypothetical protein C8R41DRAFT_620780 [Lentinula lateritia]
MSFLQPYPGMDACSPSLDQFASFSTNSKSITHRGEHKRDSISLLEAPSCEGLKENVPSSSTTASSTNTDLYFSDCSGEVSALNNFFDPNSLFGGFNTMGEMDISPPPMPDFLASPQAASGTSANTFEIERGASPSTSSESYHTTHDKLWDSAPAVTGGSDIELATSEKDNSVTSNHRTRSPTNYPELFGEYNSSPLAMDLALPLPLLQSSTTSQSGCGLVLDPLLIDPQAAPPVRSGVEGTSPGPDLSPRIDIPSSLSFINTDIDVSPTTFVDLGVNQTGNESPAGQSSSLGNVIFHGNLAFPSRASVEPAHFAPDAPLAISPSSQTGAALFNPGVTQTGYTPVMQSTHYQSMTGTYLNPSGPEMGPSTIAQSIPQPPPDSYHASLLNQDIFGLPKAEPTLNYALINPHPYWHDIALQFGVAPPPPATIIRSRSRDLVVQAGLKWDHDKGPLILPDLGYLPQPEILPPAMKNVMDLYFSHIIRPPPTADQYILWWNAVWISKQFLLKLEQQQQTTPVRTAISSEPQSSRGNPQAGKTRRKPPTSQNDPFPQSITPAHDSSPVQLPAASQPSAEDLAKMEPFSIFITETGRPRGRAARISDERSKKKARPAPY